MEESFFQKLQRVRIGDIGHIFLFLLALPVSLFYRLFRKNLWVICDNRMEARDNGYFLYEYICREHPEQDIVYAISKKSPDFRKVKDLGKTVRYGSLRHWVLYLSAKVNISSQKGGKPNAAVCYFLEVKGILRNTRAFLQHGIILSELPWLHYDNTRMKLFLTSTEQEYQFVRNQFGYPEGAVQKTGLCRFDKLHDVTVRPKQILLMPTWRSWIATPTSASKEIEDIRDFRQTTYFQAWNAFLESKRLYELLEQHDLKLVFYPHRDMQRFLSYFPLGSERIVIASWPEYDVQTLLKESAYLITDYSSISMDFAYMKKRLLYYQFDYEDFRKGQYPEGYFSYEQDGFGKVCYTLDQALDEIKKAVQEDFRNPRQYLDRHDQFFDLYDTDNCRRSYEAIAALCHQ